ncbi:hypothetical protein ACFL37_02435, partial [Candidatus Margulisiibacteriota bacterium]
LFWTAFVLLSHGFTFVAMIEGIVPIIVLVIALVAWRWNLSGGVLFVLLGFLYIVLAWGRMQAIVYLIVAGPPVLTGALFIVAALLERKKA